MTYHVYIFHNIDEYLIDSILAAIFQPLPLKPTHTHKHDSRTLAQVIDRCNHLERTLKSLYRNN